MRLSVVVPMLVLTFVGCAAEAPSPDDAVPVDLGVQPEAICTTCGDPTDPGDPTPRCTDACTSTSLCATSCLGSDNRTITCGTYGTCESCASACTATTACSTVCMNGGTKSSCFGYGTCQKYDAYCAYPVITDASVSNNNETGTGGAQAYMYFGSAGSYAKSGTFASSIGGYTYDPTIAWASNFRGPAKVTGESARPQWEWDDSLALSGWWPEWGAPSGLSVSWGSAGTPYLYGRQCSRVVAGGAIPTLTTKTESVYEDDECVLGVCNPDDYVGSFTMDRSACNAEVFGRGLARGWTSIHEATVTGDISGVRYKLWCSSCKNTANGSCSDGVVQ